MLWRILHTCLWRGVVRLLVRCLRDDCWRMPLCTFMGECGAMSLQGLERPYLRQNWNLSCKHILIGATENTCMDSKEQNRGQMTHAVPVRRKRERVGARRDSADVASDAAAARCAGAPQLQDEHEVGRECQVGGLLRNLIQASYDRKPDSSSGPIAARTMSVRAAHL